MSERNWQEDWDWVTNTNHTPYTETETIAIHWLQEIKAACKSLNDQEVELKAQQIEIKSLREQLAHANSSWQNEKNMRVELAGLAEKERKRAVAAEMKLSAIEELLIEEDEIDRECMMMARAQQG